MIRSPFHPPVRFSGSSGFALLPIILVMCISGVFLSIGLSFIGSEAKQKKFNAARSHLENTAGAVISWSVQNGRIPDAIELFSMIGVREDAWKKNIVYVYDSRLASAASGGVCGRRTTGISSNGISNIAFVLISGGDDYTIDSTPAASGAYSGNTTLSSLDLIKTITLAQLHSNICKGMDQCLDIINPELPDGCVGQAYSATLFSQGGVPPHSWSYTAKPAWVNCSVTGEDFLCEGTPPVIGENTFGIILTDADGNRLERQYSFRVTTCTGP